MELEEKIELINIQGNWKLCESDPGTCAEKCKESECEELSSGYKTTA